MRPATAERASEMTNFLLFLILIVLGGIGLTLHKILEALSKRNDFTDEDASVRAMTENVEKAKQRLPKEK